MIILIATPYFYPKVGGLEIYAEQIARQLTISGHEVHIVTSGAKSGTEELDGLTIHRFRAWGRLSNTPVSPLWALQIRRLISKIHPDVIDVHAPVPSMALAVTMAAGSTPIVVTYHAGSMKKDNYLVDALIAGYESVLLPWMLNRADHIICSSEFVRSTFLAKWSYKSTTITPGVDADVFVPSPQTVIPGSIVFIGDHRDPRKGLDVLIEAVKSLPSTTLRVVGSGQPKTDARVDYAGVKRGADLIAEIQSAQMLVLPSTTDAESFGMVLIEAMSCGLPVIGSRIGGIGGVIADGTDGILVSPNDSAELATAISSLVSDPDLAITMGQAGRAKIVNKYAWNSRGAETLEILSNAVTRQITMAVGVRHG